MIDLSLERETQPAPAPFAKRWSEGNRGRKVRGRIPLLAIVVSAFFGIAGVASVYGQTEENSEPEQLVYPSSASEGAADAEGGETVYSDLMSEGGSAAGMVVTILGYLIILGGLGVAAWFLFKRGVIRKPFSNAEGKLKIAESRMLGNRQYIMVVEYEDNKILLGVGPGKIDYLTSLQGYRSDFPKLEPQIDNATVQELA